VIGHPQIWALIFRLLSRNHLETEASKQLAVTTNRTVGTIILFRAVPAVAKLTEQL